MSTPSPTPYVDNDLALQQRHLSDLLEGAESATALRQQLAVSPLAGTEWRTETWDEYMLETVRLIARKWA